MRTVIWFVSLMLASVAINIVEAVYGVSVVELPDSFHTIAKMVLVFAVFNDVFANFRKCRGE